MRVLREIIGLFVDDLWLAGGILLWLAIFGVTGGLWVPEAWRGGVLFAGLVGLLFWRCAATTRHRG